jgi:hypothetical protein
LRIINKNGQYVVQVTSQMSLGFWYTLRQLKW